MIKKNSSISFLSLLENHEIFIKKLENESFHLKHKKEFDNWKISKISKFFGKMLILPTNIIYGKKPTYQKFKMLEVIARSPYQSWEFVSYMLLSIFFNNENKAILLSKDSDFGKYSQDNETMHLIVISEICREEGVGNVFMHTIIPSIISFFYFGFSAILFLINRNFSYELNYIFENHAYNQYDEFIKTNPQLKNKKINSKFLEYYSRGKESQYEFFKSVRNDELIHRNNSIKQILL